MIIEITLENLSTLENSFLSIAEIQHEFSVNPFAKYLVYKENDNIIGYIYYSDIYDRVEINQIEIEVLNRNCGKGSKLLERLINIVDKSITLEVRKDNFPAINLYKKFGFQEKAIRKGYYEGVDGILMEREYNKSIQEKYNS